MFKRRRFPVAIILLCVRWYCKYGISYRDLAEMMEERGVKVDPTTIMRWIHRYAPSWRSGCAGTTAIVPAPGGGRYVSKGRRPVEVLIPGR